MLPEALKTPTFGFFRECRLGRARAWIKTIAPISPIIFCSSSALLAQALKQTSREVTVLLYAPALDPHLQEMAELEEMIKSRLEESGPEEREERLLETI